LGLFFRKCTYVGFNAPIIPLWFQSQPTIIIDWLFLYDLQLNLTLVIFL
jgi:hypothetical protein